MDNDDNREMTYGYYMIGVFDVLGQSKKLEMQTELLRQAAPTDRRQRVVANLRSTVGAVIRARKLFKAFFEGARKHSGRANLLPEPLRSEMLAALSSEIVYWGVSDAIYVGVPLASKRHLAACVGDVSATLLAAASMWLTGLRVNEPIRGGIEISWGVDIAPGEIYGQALEAAYRLESRVAGRPRIVVGPGCVEYLNTIRQVGSADDIGRRFAARLADWGLSALREDADGNMRVDGLGSAVRDTFGGVPDLGEHFSEAYKNVRANCRHFRETGDQKLASRYEALLAYFDERAPDWTG